MGQRVGEAFAAMINGQLLTGIILWQGRETAGWVAKIAVKRFGVVNVSGATLMNSGKEEQVLPGIVGDDPP